MKTHDQYIYKLKTACMGFLLGIASIVNAADTSLTIRHLANEQNILSVKSATRFVLLPVQDSAPEGKVYVVVDNQGVKGMNVRMAREKVDYYVPLDLTGFEGKDLAIDVQNVPQSSLCWKEIKLSDTFDLTNRESYRPVYHHTPPYGWMNDPNGMFYKDGVYHLYYQFNPYGSTWGNMHWGHSTSTDLVSWKHEDIALAPDAWGSIFSGSCVVDHDNTAGFGAGAVIAIYTSAKPTPWGDCQTQSLAYSLDNGYTFTKYAHNPVLTSTERDFRDPKVFWYAPDKHWVMLLAVGQEMEIHTSADLKEWKKESTFGAKQGAHGGVWECPDLVELPVEGTGRKRWVLICNLNPGGPFGGSAAQYFVGSFDGKTFVNESPAVTKWLDWGKDNYATVTWSDAPQERCIALGWMSNWQYQAILPTKQYRGENTIARDLTLYDQGGELYLKSSPSPEIKKIRKEKVSMHSFNVSDTYDIAELLKDNSGTYELEMTIKNISAGKVKFCLSNEKGNKVDMYYDMKRKLFVMDRSLSGKVDFSKEFPAVTVAPIAETKEIQIRLFVDKSSIEAFGEEGKFVMTNLVFPDAPYNRISFQSEDGSYKVSSLKLYKLTL
ncbi:DUF4980 domain-containing protein [Parabacteroides faecis]|uniref:DUF4980 domain-containing protein n=1 Tax=Parabacteroides TaxID=375288 RepID=UPI000F00D4BC|nr:MULTISPECIES: DUF4980 domain-containing protein [Parabacteroides]MBC8619744.1 DUF4980 domain-containing protein [Parabacteroides faecis]RHS00554.1 DUF4980 domain-containing protein [Parabacteroides sp. AF14-59]